MTAVVGEGVAGWTVAIGRGGRLRCPHCGQGRLFTRTLTLWLDCSSCGLLFEREPYAAQVYQVVTLSTAVGLAIAIAWWLLPRIQTHELSGLAALAAVLVALSPSCLGVAVAWHYRQRVGEQNIADPIPGVPRWSGVTPPLFVATAGGLRAFASVHAAETALRPRDLISERLTPAYDATGVWFDVYLEPTRTLSIFRAKEHDEHVRWGVRLRAFPDQPPRPDALRGLLLEFLRQSSLADGDWRDVGLSLAALVERAALRLQPARQEGKASADKVGLG